MALEVRLKELREQRERERAIDWHQERELWVGALERMFGQVRLWLADYERDGYLTISAGEQTIVEEDIGRYRVPTLKLHCINRKIVFEPTKTRRSRSQGCVYVRRDDGVYRLQQLLLADRRTDAWYFAESLEMPDRLDLTRESLERVIELVPED